MRLKGAVERKGEKGNDGSKRFWMKMRLMMNTMAMKMLMMYGVQIKIEKRGQGAKGLENGQREKGAAKPTRSQSQSRRRKARQSERQAAADRQTHRQIDRQTRQTNPQAMDDEDELDDMDDDVDGAKAEPPAKRPQSGESANAASEQAQAGNESPIEPRQANAMQCPINTPGPTNTVKQEVQKIEEKILRLNAASSCMSGQVGKCINPYTNHSHVQQVPYTNLKLKSVPNSIGSRRCRCRCVNVALVMVAALCHDPCLMARGHWHSGASNLSSVNRCINHTITEYGHYKIKVGQQVRAWCVNVKAVPSCSSVGDGYLCARTLDPRSFGDEGFGFRERREANTGTNKNSRREANTGTR